MNNDIIEELQLLIDREAIRDVITRYCYGADRLDKAVLQSVYWPDAVDNHGIFVGPPSTFILDLFQKASKMDQMQHLVGNMLIRNTGSTARSETYFHGYHRLNDDGVPKDMIASGRYLDELERRDGEWRIIRRRVVFDWFRYYPDSADWGQGIGGKQVPMGARVPNDPSVDHFSADQLNLPFHP